MNTLFKLMVYYTKFEYYNFFFPFKESVQFGPSQSELGKGPRSINKIGLHT